MSDSRAANYVAEFGDDSWELDAIEPRELAQMVEDGVAKYQDAELMDAAIERQDEARNQIGILAATMDAE